MSVSYTVTYAVITVIVFCRKKCFEKMIHIIIVFALASILFNIAIFWFQCVFLYVDGFDTLYNFYASERATVISVVIYLIIYIAARHKRERKIG